MNRSAWVNTTHDWAAQVDADHLGRIQRDPEQYAPGGLVHLVLEAIAYADDEAAASGRQGVCTITLHLDGSVSVADGGRGTDTRLDEDGTPIKKPVMATQDLRFFAGVPAAYLPDGAPRRGMSTVAALSRWLIHTNRRHGGAWTQRYESGVPVTDLVAIEGDGKTGTTVHFMPGPAIGQSEPLTAARVRELASRFPHLDVLVVP